VIETFEWWHGVVTVSATLIGLGLTVFGRGFSAWSNRLNEMSDRFDRRLREMDAASEKRWSEVYTKMDSHEKRIHDLHINVERRVTFIEAKLNGGLVKGGKD